jgi:hypothetical protein
MEMARALLKGMNFPGCFWAEAVKHSVYLLKWLLTKAMGSRTPIEAWTGKKLYLGHLKIFGYRANVRSVEPHLKKLDDRSSPMVYFCVEVGRKAHKLFNPQTNKMVVSRDVVCEEEVAWKWDAEFGENSEFRDETVSDIAHVFTGSMGI